jgi:cysteinyl-tRNA synthetase
MGVYPPTQSSTDEVTQWVNGRLAERATARAARDFAKSDSIRDELASRGIQIKDSGTGTTWTKVR